MCEADRAAEEREVEWRGEGVCRFAAFVGRLLGSGFKVKLEFMMLDWEVLH